MPYFGIYIHCIMFTSNYTGINLIYNIFMVKIFKVLPSTFLKCTSPTVMPLGNSTMTGNKESELGV